MYTAREVSQRLRREFDDERLVVRLDPIRERWTVYVRRKMLTGARSWPVAIDDDGTVRAGGPSIIREVAPLEDVAFVLEDESGQYLPLDPNIIREGLIKRDSHKRDVARELMAEIRARRARKAKAQRDDLMARSLYYRGQFAKLADEMGLGGRPDYAKILAPRRRIVGV